MVDISRQAFSGSGTSDSSSQNDSYSRGMRWGPCAALSEPLEQTIVNWQSQGREAVRQAGSEPDACVLV